MRDEVGEHMARDLRPFLHTVSLQILQIPRSTLFSSSHRLSMGFRAGDCDGHDKTFSVRSLNHFCVDVEGWFRSLSCWKVQPRPILSFLAEAGFHLISAGI